MTYHVVYTPMRVIRTREWKYIQNLSPDPRGLDQNKNFEWAQRAAREPGQRCCVLRPAEELFHLHPDPHEKVNLADDPASAGIKAELRARLERWRQETNDPFPDLSSKKGGEKSAFWEERGKEGAGWRRGGKGCSESAGECPFAERREKHEHW